MFGITLASDKFFQQVVELITRLDETHLLTFAIGAVSMVVLLIIRRVNRKLPGPLVVVVGAIILSALLGWEAQGVKVVGPVPAGLPHVAVPAFTASDVLALLPAALALMILIYADEILTSASLPPNTARRSTPTRICRPRRGQYRRRFPDRLSRGDERLPHDGQRPDGREDAVGLAIAAALVIIFLLFLTPLLAPLPTATLGAIIIVASLGLIDIAAFRFLRQVRRTEFWLALVTAFGCSASASCGAFSLPWCFR